MIRLEFYIRKEKEKLAMHDVWNINAYQKAMDFIDNNFAEECRRIIFRKHVSASDFAYYRKSSKDIKIAKSRYNATRRSIRDTITLEEFEKLDRFFHSAKDDNDKGDEFDV